MQFDISIKIGGVAGDGSLTTGEVLALYFKRIGYWVTTVKDFPSNIRGLPSNFTVRAKNEPVYSIGDGIDFLIAFDEFNFNAHKKNLKSNGLVIYDSSVLKQKQGYFKNTYFVPVPLQEIARKEFGSEIMKNIIALGVIAHFLNFKNSIIEKILEHRFKEKEKEIIENNKKAYFYGREYAEKNFKEFPVKNLDILDETERYLLIGNEAIALGALIAECKFLSAYPITPASEVLHFLARHLPEKGGIVMQCEDEISSINMAIGASYAGLRAMTSTSGPGSALKTEAISLSVMSETPLVILHSMRGGPSTGLPTKTSQEDINHVIFAGHGDVQRIVLSPGTVEEAFYLTILCFNLAEKYQIPVFLLTEQAISQNHQTVEKFDINKIKIERGKLLQISEIEKMRKSGKKYLRYEITEDGISKRTIPGMPYTIFEANSSEHTPYGNIDEFAEYRIPMALKRKKKLAKAIEELPKPLLFGARNSKIGIISFGSTFGSIIEAQKILEKQGIKTKFMRLVTLWPLQEKEIINFVKGTEKTFVVEHNVEGQLLGLIKRTVGNSTCLKSIKKFTGLPFEPKEIVKKILNGS